MNSGKPFDLTKIGWCIRHTNESSLSRLRFELESEFGEKNVFLVSAGPFRQTLEAAILLMTSKPFDYVAFVDGDILIDFDSLNDGIRLCRITRNISIFQGVVIDRFFKTVRPGGIHFYSSDALAQALSFFPIKNNFVRPEYELKKYLKEKGFLFSQYSFIVGYHDYLQKPFDIYRKAYLYALKMTDLSYVFEPIWRAESHEDNEIKYFLRGLNDGYNSRKTLDIDINDENLLLRFQNSFDNLNDEVREQFRKIPISNIILGRILLHWKLLHHILIIKNIVSRCNTTALWRYLLYLAKRLCRRT